LPFFTIGHSNRTAEAFVDLLQRSGVGLVVDVRSMSRSRANPQFNADVLPQSLAAAQIGYQRAPALGGLRGRQWSVDPSPNGLWRVRSFRNYADYALGEAFAEALSELRAVGAARPAAIMCAEAVWWRCHRRIIADHLLVAGEQVEHILGPGHVEPARLTPGAQPRPDGHIVYPPQAAVAAGMQP
jgi:uncharacterized protein (DUF488 family)